MKFALKFRGRNNRVVALDEAVKPVCEPLESRLMLSTHRHTTTLAPVETISGGIEATGVTDANRVTEIRTLYGLNKLDAFNSTFPLYTNQGNNQSIVIIGSVVPFINDVPMGRAGNLSLFSGFEKIGGKTNVNRDPLVLSGFNYDPDATDDFLGAVETTGMIEWAHAMAQFANITVIECPTTNGVMAPSVLSLAIQEAVRDNQSFTNTGPINGILPGGVVVMGLTSKGEDAALTAQYDALFSYKYARTDTFIAPSGDYGGTTSMPANSPWVTSVGGTSWQTDANFARTFEIANLNSGGGLSTVEPVPAFQSGLSANGKRLTSRGTIDISLASITPPNQGLDIWYDPTLTANAPVKQYEANGTGMAAAAFGGMVADINELRNMSGLGPIGRDLNNELYNAYKTTPGAFFDVTQGNNTLYQAARGYDLATGLGAPEADLLVPALAGISTQGAALTARGDLFFQSGGPHTATGLVIPLVGTGTVDIGTQFISILNLVLTGSQSISNNGTITKTTYVATFTPTGLITRNLDNTFSGVGTVSVTNEPLPPFNVSITGKVSIGKRGRTSISGQIFTIDSRGRRLPFGAQDIFQATFSG